MRARYLALVPILALALLPNVSADAASTPTCFGHVADYVGTNEADVIGIGYWDDPRVLVTKGGNDIVRIDEDGDAGPFFICTGDGRDKIIGPATKVHGGNGEDEFTYRANCDYAPDPWLFRVEAVYMDDCMPR